MLGILSVAFAMAEGFDRKTGRPWPKTISATLALLDIFLS
jgi:hypothetical protein